MVLLSDNSIKGNGDNVIWVFGDQHPAHALGCNGNPNIHTPNIDRMAAAGMNFDRAVSGYPLCCPYRGSLLTSTYPHHCISLNDTPLPEGAKTIADAFNAHDYHTAYFGKWHVNGKVSGVRSREQIVPRHRRGGFDTWIGYENNNSQWATWVHGHEASGDEIEHYRLPGYETDCLTDLFIDYLRDRGRAKDVGDEQPFFAALSVQPPHDPYLAPAEWMGRHTPAKVQLRKNVPDIPRVKELAQQNLAGAYAMIENLDHNVGRIRQALVDAGLHDNTHIVFFSDHGDMHGSHGQWAKCVPWEESIRVPFIIQGQKDGYLRSGRSGTPLNHIDVAPTTLGLCGLPTPDWMQGTDYSHHRIGHAARGKEPDSAYLQFMHTQHLSGKRHFQWRGVVTQDGWKYVCLEEGVPWLLYNLNEDPYEQSNLVFQFQYVHKRQELQDRLAQWIRDTEDIFELPRL